MPIPVDFDQRNLPIVELDPTGYLHIYSTKFTPPNPLYLSKGPSGRFNDPGPNRPDSYGVLYAAPNLITCVAEVVIRSGANRRLAQDVAGRRGILAVKQNVDQSAVAELTISPGQHVRLADLRDIDLYLLGGDAEEINSLDYANSTQIWSEAIHVRPENVDGILYKSRFLNAHDSVAIFERGLKRVALTCTNTTPLTTHPDWWSVVSDLSLVVM